jgi:hypothetical protein
MPKILAWTQQRVDSMYVTIISQVVVYAPTERAETFSLFPLFPSLLCGCVFETLGPLCVDTNLLQKLCL